MSWCHSTGRGDPPCRNCAPAAGFGDSVKPTVSDQNLLGKSEEYQLLSKHLTL